MPDRAYKAVKERSDRLMNYFLTGHFLLGFIFARFYDTWFIAVGVGGSLMVAYYSIKYLLPQASLYQYVLSGVFGLFMAQFIYQMHGMFEMHFFAFIASATLIIYQNWKLQIPLLVVVFIHHALFSYLQNIGIAGIHFTQLNFFDMQTFVIHILLTMAIIFICGLWAYQLNKCNQLQIAQTAQLSKLQKAAHASVERRIKEEALEERNNILESIGNAFFAVDKHWTVTYWNNMSEVILKMPRARVIGKSLWSLFPDAIDTPFYLPLQTAMEKNVPQHFEASYHGVNDWYETSVYPSKNGVSVYLKDITERKASELMLKQLNDNLEQQAKELEFSNDELERFAYVASHDLQEPLRMVTSFMAQLERKYGHLIDDKGKQYIHFAVDGAKRMRQIILDLLDFSRVGRFEDKLEMVDLNEIMDDLAVLFRKQITERKATIKHENLPAVMAFKAPLKQVFQNLVGNSLKYHHSNRLPVISISAEERPTEWIFSIMDNGIGINEAYFEKIFIIFQRLHTQQEYPGTGVGLAITKKIIENIGGKIWVNSVEGEGSTFSFSLPRR